MIRLLYPLVLASVCIAADKPFEGEIIFPLEKLFACPYNGSGERKADDVKVLASRPKKGGETWSTPALLHDTPNLPETNPILFVDSKSRLWFIWSVITANQWETALARFKISSNGWKSAISMK